MVIATNCGKNTSKEYGTTTWKLGGSAREVQESNSMVQHKVLWPLAIDNQKDAMENGLLHYEGANHE
jgi:hypothetical protein